jgi:hypothetical protein
MERIRGELILSSEQDKEEHKSSSGTKRETESSILEEELRLKTKGDVFDPRLLTYMAGLGFGLNQQSFKSETQSSSDSGDMNSYRLNMNFLSMKPYPFSINMSKTDRFVPRRFQSPLRVENTSSGVSLKLRNPDWPMTFRWSKDEIEQKSDVGSTEDFFNRSSNRFSYTLLHDFSERSHLTFRSDLDDVTRESQISSRDTKTIRHRLLHDFYFGRNQQHSLDSSISFVDKTGDFERQTFEWNENMRLKHTENFSSFYNTFLSKSTFESTENRTTGGSAGFSHQLYQNLITNFSVFANKSEFGADSESTLHGGNLRFDYTRNNRWGRLLSEYSVRLTNQKSESGTGTVTDETHVFSDGTPIFLRQNNIVGSSIVVTDNTGTEVYTRVDDYTISQDINGRTELIPVPMGLDPGDILDGDIADGQVLLVSYLFEIAEEREEDFVSQFFRIKQEFNNGLSAYYSHKDRNSQVDSDLETSLSDREYTTDTFGVGYTNKYVTLRAEHSDTESTEHSSETDIVSASCFWPLTPQTSFHGLVSQSWIESSGINSRETSTFRAEGKIRTRLTKYLKLSGTAELRDKEDSDIGPTEGLRMGIALQYNRRALSVRAGWDSYFLERYNTERDASKFYIKLIRRF